MDDNSTPTGQRFSHVYIPKGVPLQDSPRMRRRLAACLADIKSKYIDDVIERELGVPVIGELSSFFIKAEIRDVLDTITVAYNFAFGTRTEQIRWLSEVSRIFKEENARYKLDAECGVHFSIDQEYEQNIASAVSGLGNPRYVAAYQAFDGAQTALDRAEPDFKEALRDIFEAVEIVFKLILPETKRISSRDIADKLKPLMATLYPDSPTAGTVAPFYLDSLSAWVNGVHNYRHGQPMDSAPQPPLDLSVALMSSGVAFLRWLIEVDQALLSQLK